MFSDYQESGPTLFKGEQKLGATFRFTNTNVTIANTLRRAILTLTPSIGFRTEPYEKSDVVITTNTTPLVNEMISHRVGMIPICVTDLANFKPDLYEFILDMKNDTKEVMDVRASDFKVYMKNPENPLDAPTQLKTEDYFPPDPITGDTVLITRLRPQWNPTAPKEQLTLKAKASLSTGAENIRWSPVSQVSYEYTRDPTPEHVDLVFKNWLSANKKIEDLTAVQSDALDAYRREFNTMEIQRCYLKDERGNPYDFTFFLESIGVQPIPMIVANALAAATSLVTKYIDIDTALPDTIRLEQADTRYPAIDIYFTNEGHTLGNMLETYIVDNHIDGTAQPPVSYVAYKVPHPLKNEMYIRIGLEQDEDIETQKNIAINVLATSCRALKAQFVELSSAWEKAHP
jgi:DNA-directed RNA polymerase subunit L